jgi:hypothetical protein
VHRVARAAVGSFCRKPKGLQACLETQHVRGRQMSNATQLTIGPLPENDPAEPRCRRARTRSFLDIQRDNRRQVSEPCNPANDASPRERQRRWLPIGMLAAVAAIQLVMAFGIYVGWEQENNVLRQQALKITHGLHSDAQRAIAINNWVYRNKGFERNRSYFALPQLGPTPLQVFESGGFCADKSRLTAAMLSELGIRAGLVMLSPCAECAPTHTVVEAAYEHGRMVIDSIWNIYYVDGDGKFLGVVELDKSDRARQYIQQLRQVEDLPHDTVIAKIKRMSEEDAYSNFTFDFAKSINWDRNWATGAAAAILQAAGISPATMMRPRLLEDPKLTISVALLVGGIACVLAVMFSVWRRRTRQVPR